MAAVSQSANIQFSPEQLPLFSNSMTTAPPIYVGDRVVYLGVEDTPEHGTVKWVGLANGEWTVGLELDNPVGNTDGKFKGQRLFYCKPCHGLIIDTNCLITEMDYYGNGANEEVSDSLPTSHAADTDSAVTTSLSHDASALTPDSVKATSTAVSDYEGHPATASSSAGDDVIEKFLSSKSNTGPCGGSFDRRVYARMFVDCEVDKWYEALDVDREGTLKLGMGGEPRKKCDMDSRVPDCDRAREERKKKGRGGIFRFIRWLRRRKSSASASSAGKRPRRAVSAHGTAVMRRGAHSSSVESMTSLSNSFHYIPSVFYGSDTCRTSPASCTDRVYEDIDCPAPKAGSAGNAAKSKSLPGPGVAEQERLRMVEEKSSAVRVSSSSSNVSRKKRCAPLPPSGAGSKRSTPGCEPSSCQPRLNRGRDGSASNLNGCSHRMASSTGVIYEYNKQEVPKKSSKKLEKQNSCTRLSDKDDTTTTATALSSTWSAQSKLNRVGAYVRSKGRAPQPPETPSTLGGKGSIENGYCSGHAGMPSRVVGYEAPLETIDAQPNMPCSEQKNGSPTSSVVDVGVPGGVVVSPGVYQRELPKGTGRRLLNGVTELESEVWNQDVQFGYEHQKQQQQNGVESVEVFQESGGGSVDVPATPGSSAVDEHGTVDLPPVNDSPPSRGGDDTVIEESATDVNGRRNTSKASETLRPPQAKTECPVPAGVSIDPVENSQGNNVARYYGHTNVNISDLQELVESLVLQYCSTKSDGQRQPQQEVKACRTDAGEPCFRNEEELARMSDRSSPEAAGRAVLTEPVGDRFADGALPVTSNVSEGSSMGSLPEEKPREMSSNGGETGGHPPDGVPEEAEEVVPERTSPGRSLLPTAGCPQDADDDFSDRLLQRWQMRMQGHLWNLNVHERKHAMSENVLYAISNGVPKVESGISADDDAGCGIYEPIGNVYGEDNGTNGKDYESVSSSSLRKMSSSRLNEDVGMLLHQRDGRRASGQEDKNGAYEDVPLRPCHVQHHCEGGSSGSSDRVIRRLSVNGERHNVPDGDHAPSSAGTDAKRCRRTSREQEVPQQDLHHNHHHRHRGIQFPIYENVAHGAEVYGLRRGGQCWRRNCGGDCCSSSVVPPQFWAPSPVVYTAADFSPMRGFAPAVPLAPPPFVPSHFPGRSLCPSYVQAASVFGCHCAAPRCGGLENGAQHVPSKPRALSHASRHLAAGAKRANISPVLSRNPFLQEDAAQRRKQLSAQAVASSADESKTSDDEEGKRTYVNLLSADARAAPVPSPRRNSDSVLRPPVPPPRTGSAGRSLRLAANCSWLKEKGKSVEAKVREARAWGDVLAHEETEVETAAKDVASGGEGVPRSAGLGGGGGGGRINCGGPSSRSDLDGCGSVVIGGVTVRTPFSLWPLEYELVAPELSRLKAKLAGRPVSDAGSSDSSQMGDESRLATRQLLKQLEFCLSMGHTEEAAMFARDLAQLKIQCSVTQNMKPAAAGASSEIILNMFVEDRVSHHGPIPIRVDKSISVCELKRKIFREFEFPTEIQRWILGRKLVVDDGVLLSTFGVERDGCPVFLYLLTPENVPLRAEDLQGDKERGKVRKMAPRAAVSDDPEAGTNELEEHDLAFGMEQMNIRLPPAEAETSSLITGWHCEVCTLVNVPTRPGCEACGCPRPTDYTVPDSYTLRDSERERLRQEREADEKFRNALLEAEMKERAASQANYERLMMLEEQDLITNEDVFECNICFGEVGSRDGVKLRDCLHVFCRVCLAHVIMHSEEATVLCPFRDDDYSCSSALQEREIRALVPDEAFQRHLQKSVTTAESQAQNSFHCKTPDCKGWCLFDDDVNEFRCPVCLHDNCLTCQVIHEGLNCRQYQDRIFHTADADSEARKTKEVLDDMVARGEALHCPNCNIIIMKKWGCDWICCTICKLEICWVTKMPRWGRLGKGDISGGCRCGVGGVRCHPNCNYCH